MNVNQSIRCKVHRSSALNVLLGLPSGSMLLIYLYIILAPGQKIPQHIVPRNHYRREMKRTLVAS